MQAIIRLKRPLEDSPSDTLILNCNKKQKLDTATYQTDEEPSITVLKFTGTQKSQDEDVTKYVANLSSLKASFCNSYKKRETDIAKKLKLEAQEISKNNRYKVISCLRSNLGNSSDESLAIYDLELGCEAKEPISDKKFVYDLYYTRTNVLEEILDYNISVYPTTESLVFDSDATFSRDEESDYSEDSNAENNWRNDYPDESDVESVNEDDIVEAIRNVNINDDTLSSDDECAHCAEDNDDYFYDLDESEEKSHGKMYARFRAKYKTDSESEEDNSFSLSD